MKTKKIICFAAVSGAVAVGLGAFGAHSLQQLVEDGSLTDGDLKTFETAVRYQFYHTFALLMLPAIGHLLKEKQAKFAANSFMCGILIFSGSLYLLALSPLLFGEKLSWLGAITPIGGLFFIVGWTFLFLSAINKSK